jgi:hypothetical protein
LILAGARKSTRFVKQCRTKLFDQIAKVVFQKLATLANEFSKRGRIGISHLRLGGR